MIAVLAMLCVQPVSAQDLTVRIWTNKTQYNPGEKGVLKISILNEEDAPYEIYEISINYPWKLYDADKGEWVGNETIKGDTRILASLASKGGDYYTESEFTVPSDGRAIIGSTISIEINRSDPDPPLWEVQTEFVGLEIAAPSIPMLIKDLDTWMTSLTVVIVICTIILAIVVFLSTRKARAPRALVPPPPPPPPKAKVKAE